MIQDIHTVLKNNRRKNERNKDMQSRNKQCAIRAITPLAVEQPQTLDLLSTATHWWQSRTIECSRSRSNETWYKGEGWFKKYTECSRTTEERTSVIYMQSGNKQCAIRAITPLAVEQPQTLDLLSTATHWWQSRTDSAQEAEATRRNIREKDDSRYTHSAQEQPKKERA